jgi:HSP20 family molecular chaperone IbpA
MTLAIEDVIHEVERIYQSLVGAPPPAIKQSYAPFPPGVDPTKHVEQEMARLLHVVETAQTAGLPYGTWSPLLSISSQGREWMFCFDLAGIDREDIQVSIVGNHLCVTGCRRIDRMSGEARMSERCVGRFRRVAPLPEGALVDEIDAVLRNGVLEVKVVRGEETAAKAVTVK